MTTLANMDVVNPIHLLLIGDSKVGKSTYAAAAAKAGFTLLYLDSDNGISALHHHLKDDPAALARVHYIRTDRPAAFMLEFVDSSPIFRWNKTQDMKYSRLTAKPDDKIFEVNIEALYTVKNFVLVQDSWTAFSEDAMKFASKEAGIAIEIGKQIDQRLYGAGGLISARVTGVIQHAPFDVITIAHGAIWEVFEKNIGEKQGGKQKDLTLKDVVEVPVSTSYANGYKMGKYFNYIGWLGVDRMGRTEIDFTRKPNRVGGGPPNKKVPLDQLMWKDIKQLVPDVEFPEGIISERLASEFQTPTKTAAPSGLKAGINLPAKK